jgi:predicted amidophosphoribosyltransferase
MGRFAALVQGVADFLVDDDCHLCHRPSDDELARRLDPVRGAVARAVEVRVPGGATVRSHPVCARCAVELEPAGPTAVLGWRLPDGAILTRGGLIPGPPGPSAPPPGALTATGAFRSNPALLRVIHLVKFSRVVGLVEGLAEAIALSTRPSASGPVLVPVPMDRAATRRRGFNQSERIASALGKRWGCEVLAGALVKPRPTRAQSLTPREERLSNVRDAFEAAEGGEGGVAGCDVVLVDDLVTTGATAAAAASALHGAGAASVTVACVGVAA